MSNFPKNTEAETEIQYSYKRKMCMFYHSVKIFSLLC